MRILFINSVFGIRSTGRIVADLVNHYESLGHECKVAYGRESVPSEIAHKSYKIGTESDVRIAALEARIRDNAGFANIHTTLRFLEWANEYDPDVLWLHNLHGYYINIELLFSWIKSRERMKVYWTLHDCWAFTGHCSNYQIVECRKWMHCCKNCVQTMSYPQSFIDNSEKNFHRKKNCFQGVQNMTIIAPSFWIKTQVEQSFLSSYDVVVQHNKIDLVHFNKTNSRFREKYCIQDKFVILGVQSAWGKSKGLYDFDKLAQVLNNHYQIVLVGITEKQKRMLSDRIICVPRTNSIQELAEIYSAADLFLNLTYQDNYPTVNLEAQACETACITYRTGGSPESVPKENVVDKGNLSQIIEMISKGNYAPALDPTVLYIEETRLKLE